MRTNVCIATVLTLAAWAAAQTLPASAKPGATSQPVTAAKTVKAEPAVAAPGVEMAVKAADKGFRPLLEQLGDSGIDWTRGTILATGQAKATGDAPADIAMAKRAARLVAARNAVLVMASLRLDAEGATPQIKEGQINVEGIVDNFTEASSDFNQVSKVARVTLEMPLCGAKGAVTVLGVQLKAERGQSWDWPGADIEGAGSTDVVVIDARDMKFKPSLSPRIATTGGRMIFASGDLPPAELGKRLPAAYLYLEFSGMTREAKSIIAGPLGRAQMVAGSAGRIDPQLQQLCQESFRNPLIITAQATAKDSPGTIVLSSAGEKELALHPEAKKLMEEGKLIIVTDIPRK